MRLRAFALLAVATVAATAAHAQTVVRGAVIDSLTGAPLSGALVTARGAGRATTTDRFGHFVLPLDRFPDTLAIAHIGRAAMLVPVVQPPAAPLSIRMSSRAVTLADVIVTAPPGAARPVEDVGRWQVPAAAARGVPPAIEPDVLRSLTLVPAVSFSTPLSARPIIRGYDAGESSVRIDGFEVVNLYHIGRIFSAFPTDAASATSVAAAPQGASTGGTVAGTVDITGQTGEPGRVHGGADLTLASATAWAGGGAGAGATWFGAARVVHLSVLNAAAGGHVPYDFQDVYANALVFRGGRPVGKVTAFVSRDQLFDRDLGSGMNWGTWLLGGRWQAVDDGRRTVSLWTSANRFAEDVADVPARYSRIDVRNRFDRLGVGADMTLHGDRSRVGLGISLGRRAIGNRITPRAGTDFVPTDAEFRLTELGLYTEWAAVFGRTSVQAGVRLDAAGTTRVVQPRARVAVPLAAGASLGVAVGRTARLFHLVADPQSEPEIAFYDFWLNAGEGGVPVPTIDHATIDVDVNRGRFAGRLSLFASRARGLVELRPSTDQQAAVSAPFRDGNGRAGGVELQVGVRGDRPDASAMSATYVLSFAERDWGSSWIPWAQDRRHLLRLMGRTRFGAHWSLSAAFEASSGPPVTPVEGVLMIGILDPAGGGLTRDGGVRPAFIYASENSARSSGTARADLAANYAFTGLWKSRMSLGLSVVNAGFGPVAPVRASRPTFDPGLGSRGQVRYERLFDLPAVPSVTLRVEF